VARKRLKGIGFFDNYTGTLVGWSNTHTEAPRGCYGSPFYWLTKTQVELLKYDQAKSVELVFEHEYSEKLRSKKYEANN
jgi:hypothetical protein